MIRMLKSAKNSAVIARTQAVNQMKALVLTAPAELRKGLRSDHQRRYQTMQKLPPRSSEQPHDSSQVRTSFACLSPPSTQQEIQDLKGELERLIQKTAPVLVEAFGVGPDTAAAPMLIAAGRSLRGCLRIAVRSESCTSIIRQDQPASAQSWWRSPGQCGFISSPSFALFHDLRTQAYLRRRTAEGMSKTEVSAASNAMWLAKSTRSSGSPTRYPIKPLDKYSPLGDCGHRQDRASLGHTWVSVLDVKLF